MKKTLALALVLVMVISSVCLVFASAEVPATSSTFWVTHFADGTAEGAGNVIAGDKKDNATQWSTHVAFEPVEGVANTYKIAKINRPDGSKKPADVQLEVPKGGFVYTLNGGNNYPDLLAKEKEALEKETDETKKAAHEANIKSYTGKPNYKTATCEAMMKQVEKWAEGDIITINGLDLTSTKVPTDTPDKQWYEDGYKCTATYVKYDPNAATEEPSEDTPSAEPVEVKEEIVVDGKLDDTGWTKAEWKTINTETGTQQVQPKEDADKVALGDLEYQFAVRADDENIYVAVKVNALPHNCSVADTMDAKVSSGTHFRFYFTPDEDVAAYGKDGAMAVLDTLLDILVENDGTLGIYKSKEPTTDATAVMTKTETDSVYEISIKKSLFNIGDVFRMATSYSDCHFGSENAGYNVLNDHKYDVASEGGADTPWATNAHYAKYTVADLTLGTYTEEPQQPEKPDPAEELKKELAEKVTPVENADFKVDLDSKLEKNDAGKLVYTVTLKIKDIKEGVHMQSFLAVLHYDPKVLKLTTEVNEDNTLKCEVKVPGSKWENLVKVDSDKDGNPTGVINVEYVCTDKPFDEATKDNFELTFTFEVLTDATVVGVYVDSEDATSQYAANDDQSSELTNYKGEGNYTVAAFTAPAEESSSSSSSAATSSTTPSKPGDAGILIFAVLGIVAIAGAVTVIKVRR